MSRPVLEISGLQLDLIKDRARTTLVEDVSFSLSEGEVLGLVGESGSGKSLTCRATMRLLPPKIEIARGSILLEGRDIVALPEPEVQKIRGRRIGMIFQNPSSYLDPVMTVGNQIGESLRIHKGLSRKEALRDAQELLKQVGIPDPGQRVHSFPHEFSGGMRQRVMIAAALACRPTILIGDEPTTALDVTIQAQILRLLLDLRDQLGLAIILVTHDLSVVAQTCDRVVVMYAGRVMEFGSRDAILTDPRHPYSKGLIASQPELAVPGETLRSIPGQPPTVNDRLPGCPFAPRCSLAATQCEETSPPLAMIAVDRASACHFWRDEGFQ